VGRKNSCEFFPLLLDLLSLFHLSFKLSSALSPFPTPNARPKTLPSLPAFSLNTLRTKNKRHKKGKIRRERSHFVFLRSLLLSFFFSLFLFLLHSLPFSYRISQLTPASDDTHTFPKKIPAISFCPEAEPAIEYQSVAAGAPPVCPPVVVPPSALRKMLSLLAVAASRRPSAESAQPLQEATAGAVGPACDHDVPESRETQIAPPDAAAARLCPVAEEQTYLHAAGAGAPPAPPTALIVVPPLVLRQMSPDRTTPTILLPSAETATLLQSAAVGTPPPATSWKDAPVSRETQSPPPPWTAAATVAPPSAEEMLTLPQLDEAGRPLPLSARNEAPPSLES